LEIVPKLDYIRGLGFNAISLLPIEEWRNQALMGYATTDFFAPDDDYASSPERAVDELRYLVDQAHQRGLAVLFDVVYGHSSTDANRYWCYDGGQKDGGIYFEGGANSPWGRGFAFRKPQVRDFFRDNCRFLFREYNIDGLRFDAVQWIERETLVDITGCLRREFPGKVLIAEYGHDDNDLIDGADPLRDLGFHYAWNLGGNAQFLQAAKLGGDAEALAGLLGGTPGRVNYLLGSHDNLSLENGGAYLAQRLGGRDNPWARSKCRLAWALNATLPGLPMLFMGSEGLLDGGWGVSGDSRLDWEQLNRPQSQEMRRLVSDCNRLRSAHDSLRGGTLLPLPGALAAHVVAFKRYNLAGDVLLVVVNCGDQDFPRFRLNLSGDQGGFQEVFNSQAKVYGGSGVGNEGATFFADDDGFLTLCLPNWSVLIFRKL
jgi:1,4-alpha-glucan branching enzyme